MATNTGKRKCKQCKKEFIKTYPLQCRCSNECEIAHKKSHVKKTIKNTLIVKKQTKIKNVSDRNKFNQSDGTKISAKTLESYITLAKAAKIAEMDDNYGYIFCEDCNEFGHPPGPINEMELKIIDCSHQISVKEAKESGRAELCYDIDNIRMRCRIHHRIHDKTI
jgi:hypothetical protein